MPVVGRSMLADFEHRLVRLPDRDDAHDCRDRSMGEGVLTPPTHLVPPL